MSWLARLFQRSMTTPSNVTGEGVGDDVIERFAGEMPHVRMLPSSLRIQLQPLIKQFIAEKEFWGSKQYPVTDPLRVAIAAQASLLVLNRPDLGLFPQTREIVIRPDDFGEVVEAIAPDGRKFVVDMRRIGEASYRGPILLAHHAIKQTPRDRLDGRNTVMHEFAHALDYLDGEADGIPPLESAERRIEWQAVLESEMKELRSSLSRGRRTLLDGYGAENLTEFFAVATEHFFEEGRRVRRNHPRLYGLLRSFYRLDPAEW
jgi:Mlc titration factor MtfA (ptsG expression regulator)